MPVCAKCGKDVASGVNFCSFCGAPVNAKVLPQEQAQYGIIVVMWLLTLGYFIFWEQKVAVIATLCGFCSFVFGVALSLRRNQADRVNGLFRVGIGIVMGLITYTTMMQR